MSLFQSRGLHIGFNNGGGRLGSKRRAFTGVGGGDFSVGTSVASAETQEVSMDRRRQSEVSDDPRWMRRGLFKPGHGLEPKMRGGKLYTKGKAR